MKIYIIEYIENNQLKRIGVDAENSTEAIKKANIKAWLSIKPCELLTKK